MAIFDRRHEAEEERAGRVMFEVFTQKGTGAGRRASSTPTAMFAGTSVIFNATARRAIGDATHVLVLVERAERLVAFEPTLDADRGYKIGGNGSTGTIGASRLCRELGIEHGTRCDLTVQGRRLVARLP